MGGKGQQAPPRLAPIPLAGRPHSVSHTHCPIFFRQEEELLLVAALSYLSTHCLFMSLCCIHLLPWCQPYWGLAGDRPVFTPASFPGLLGLTAPQRAWIHRSSHKDAKRSVSIAGPWEETHLLLAIYSHRPFVSETTDTILKWRKTTTQPLMGWCLPGLVCVHLDRRMGTNSGRYPTTRV